MQQENQYINDRMMMNSLDQQHAAWLSTHPGPTGLSADQQEALKKLGIKIYHYSNGAFSAPDTQITSSQRFINGMNCSLADAERISEHEMGEMKISEFDLVYIPSLGFANDLVRATADKLGFTTETAKALAGIIQQAGPGEWYAHSYGGVAFTEAVRFLGDQVPAGQSVTFLAGANNQRVTASIMRNAGVNVREYTGSWFDLVPNIVGFNSLNPIQWGVDILVSWSFFTDWSPHTYPPVPTAK
jgi:hypothetical protein